MVLFGLVIALTHLLTASLQFRPHYSESVTMNIQFQMYTEDAEIILSKEEL